ncbi:hypothetical protein COLO4_01448, partial [Corchorus olitorius]
MRRSATLWVRSTRQVLSKQYKAGKTQVELKSRKNMKPLTKQCRVNKAEIKKGA